jgi:hypothetical protein
MTLLWIPWYNLFYRKDPNIPLNYSIFLYNKEDKKEASSQFKEFESRVKAGQVNLDAEVCNCYNNNLIAVCLSKH